MAWRLFVGWPFLEAGRQGRNSDNPPKGNTGGCFKRHMQGKRFPSRSDGPQPVIEPLQPVPRWGRLKGRLELEPVTVAPMDQLKRSCVVSGKIRAVTNAQDGRILQLAVE